ncbi:hypothetical protein [Amycolatopsis sp. SID8362]|uniref:hypothetical protein n=1 Tax=Amycolatopsis sp. SID8362 TaxID=2690346 RepID=UPI00136BE4CE|nr:hypothetical protein [Amycolatopsis sp. SID8362]NBH01940.1 hypothetical protein [Amycolatopsis sp. SID8362]NED38643.1 hypothetical protein [Amycolatopsis sp. SID8362]
MSTQIQDAVAALKAALEAVGQLDGRVYENPAATVTGVGAVIAPPTVEWGSYGHDAGPTEAAFVVHLVVPFDEYATTRLYELVEPMREAIEGDPLFSVTSASPGLLQQGGTQLPTYALTVDVGL